MSTKSVILLAALSVVFAGCGKSKSNNTPVDNRQYFEDSEALKEAVANHYVECGVEGLDCPDFSAKILSWEQESEKNYYTATCSGSLYQGKYIITNSHCIPEKIKKPGADCSKTTKALFPKNKNFDAEEAMCARVVQVFDENGANPDLAVIELARVVNRKSVLVATSSFIENSNTHAFVMDPSTSDKFLGVIRHKTCTLSTDNAYTVSASTNSATGILYGDNCNVISGNSGTGLLNEKFELIGAVYARFDRYDLRDAYRNANLPIGDETYMGAAQNITCLKSITSNLGFTCDMNNFNKENVSAYVKRAIEASEFKNLPLNQIEYKLGAGFKLKLSKAYFTGYNTLDTFESKWLRMLGVSSSDGQKTKMKQSLLSR